MKDIPEWIGEFIKTGPLCCNRCKDTFDIENLISIGIQESSVKPHDNKLCIGMYCLVCKEITIFELKEMSLVEFACEILKQEKEFDNCKKSNRKALMGDVLREISRPRRRKRPRSKITKKEANEDIRFLKNVKTHEEFLVAMGLSPEQIEQYNYKKSEEEEHGG